ncbi:hypothetical protein D3C85_1559000 [compost metagenome]
MSWAVMSTNTYRPRSLVILTSYQVTSCLTNSARPKLKITKYTPDSRSVASPTTSAMATPTPRAISSTAAQGSDSPNTAVVYAPTPKNATVASET